MKWPVGSLDDVQASIKVTPQQHAMFELYYALGMAHLWKKKVPNVELFPGTKITVGKRPTWHH